MADLIADRIRAQIADGALADGEWLPTEPTLMARFGVSRPTLREAFRLLEADSLITIRRGPPGGARVTVPGPEAAADRFGLLLTLSGATLHDVYEARLVIEPPAARRLAERGTVADRRQLAAHLEELRARLDDPAAFGRLAGEFHLRLVELSGNRTLSAVIGMLTEIITQHVDRGYSQNPRPAEDIATDHRRALRSYERLVEHINARDGEAAERFWLKHLRAVRPYLLQDNDNQVVDLLH
jgi:DNA-binding FadR family transcriptional regulator